jgi:zeta-carotene desaturase
MRVAIIGAGLAGLATGVYLAEAGHEVQIYEARPFAGGKVGSWQDAEGNHIEMGLHVFFCNYSNLFALMKKVGAYENLLPKQHVHTFVNRGGRVASLDFRFPLGAPFNGLKAFFTTNQLSWADKLRNALALGTSPLIRGLLDYEGAMQQIRALDRVSFAEWFRQHGGSEGSLKRMWNPIAYALGFIDTEQISARCMLTIFQMFASKTDASKLNFLKGSPDNYLTQPIVRYLQARGGQVHTRRGVSRIEVSDSSPYAVTGLVLANGERVEADVYVCATAVEGAKRLIPQVWRQWPQFDNLYKLDSVPVATVQLRFDGWVTELNPQGQAKRAADYPQPLGIDNLLYTADADFSCFADLALTSPADYYKPGQGSLLQCVLTPGDPFISMSNEAIAQHVLHQVHELFPSSRQLNLTWYSVVKLAHSLYREAPGMEPYRPPQKTPVPNFFLAGSYTAQDYIDSMEGATLSGQLAAQAILAACRDPQPSPPA